MHLNHADTVSVLSLIIACLHGVIGSVTTSLCVATEPGFLPFTSKAAVPSLSLLGTAAAQLCCSTVSAHNTVTISFIGET